MGEYNINNVYINLWDNYFITYRPKEDKSILQCFKGIVAQDMKDIQRILSLCHFVRFTSYQMNMIRSNAALVMNKKNEGFAMEDEKIWDPFLKSPKKTESINKKRALKPS